MTPLIFIPNRKGYINLRDGSKQSSFPTDISKYLLNFKNIELKVTKKVCIGVTPLKAWNEYYCCFELVLTRVTLSGAFRVEMQRESQKDRTILCKYEPTEPGDYRIEVRWSGEHVPGPPLVVMLFDTEEELNRFLQVRLMQTLIIMRELL